MSCSIYLHHLLGSSWKLLDTWFCHIGIIVHESIWGCHIRIGIMLIHSPLEFIIGCTYLILISWTIRMEPIGWNCLSECRENIHLTSEFPDFRLVEITDRAHIHSSITVLREESDTIILYPVPCSSNQKSECSCHRIEWGHSKSWSRIGKSQSSISCSLESICNMRDLLGHQVEHLSEILSPLYHIRKIGFEPGDMFLSTSYLCFTLMDWHLDDIEWESCFCTESRYYRWIHTSRYSNYISALHRIVA